MIFCAFGVPKLESALLGALLPLFSTLASCSPDQKHASPTDAGIPGTPLLLPAACDGLPSEVALADYSADGGIDADYVRRIAAAGDSVLYAHADAIYSAALPNGAPARFVSFPTDAFPTPIDLFNVDLWVDETSIVVATGGALYTAPRSGGTASLVSGTMAFANSPIDGITSVRKGDSVYYAVDSYPAATNILRQPIAGGPASSIATVPGTFLFLQFAVGDTVLFYFDESTTTPDAGVWSIPLDGGQPSEVWPGIPVVLGTLGDDLYAVSSTDGAILRIPAGHKAPSKRWPLPPTFETTLSLNGHPPAVEYAGDLYFVGSDFYQLPDDRRQVFRPVVIRVRPDADELEVRCVPAPPFNPTVPEGGQGDIEVDDLTASENGVFLLQHRATSANSTNLHLFDTRRDPHAVKVFP